VHGSDACGAKEGVERHSIDRPRFLVALTASTTMTRSAMPVREGIQNRRADVQNGHPFWTSGVHESAGHVNTHPLVTKKQIAKTQNERLFPLVCHLPPAVT